MTLVTCRLSQVCQALLVAKRAREADVETRPDFDQRPFIVIWETTQACDLACLHCRACAQPVRSSLELRTEEAKRLIDEVKVLGAPVFVLTGGDPLTLRVMACESLLPPALRHF